MTSSNFLTTKISYLHSALRASTHFVTIIITIDGFFCQFQINLDIFSWMQDYLLKNWNLFQSFCYTLYPNSKNFSVLLKARTKRNWTFEDFQVSTVFVDIIALPHGGKFKLSMSSSAKIQANFWNSMTSYKAILTLFWVWLTKNDSKH